MTEVQTKYKEKHFSDAQSFYQPYHLQMEGMGDYIKVNNKDCPTCFDLTDRYTMMAWIKPSSFGDQRIIDKNTAGTIDGYNFDLQRTANGRGTPRLCAAGNCFTSHISLTIDVWNHVAVVFSVNNPDIHKNKIVFYVNGEQDIPQEFFTGTAKNNHNLFIGKSASVGHVDKGTYHGYIDNVAIFNRSLSAQEVLSMMWNKPIADQERDLLLYYDFDVVLSRNSHQKTYVMDKSIYGNHGEFERGEKGIYNPYSESMVKRTWGEYQMAEKVKDWTVRAGGQKLDNIDDEDYIIWIKPGETILGHTNEFIGGNTTVTTMMKARSSLGRNFIEVCKCAGWGDVGYQSRWTMEITNNSRNYSIPLVVGRRIAQIIFFDTEGIVGPSYESSGKYQLSNDINVLKQKWNPTDMLPKMYKDREITSKSKTFSLDDYFIGKQQQQL
eukprot:gene6274-7279_t